MNLDDAAWRKATASGDNGQCVEVATNLPGIVAVRDSKDPDGPALVFTDEEWAGFLDGDGPGMNVATDLAGMVSLRKSGNPDGPALTFTDGEWVAFWDGVDKHEFDV
ncbi:hypothetical protein HNR40_005683 [Nonomuraea endophytica]|uniref:DUF397 domain-containing protein n=1 Tax=Nonomuraea endophytica TaxID=714136 RepID=A0A7W8A7Q3_9ACTN|nr:hypothetical protein [Nonomuraea endophytica]